MSTLGQAAEGWETCPGEPVVPTETSLTLPTTSYPKHEINRGAPQCTANHKDISDPYQDQIITQITHRLTRNHKPSCLKSLSLGMVCYKALANRCIGLKKRPHIIAMEKPKPGFPRAVEGRTILCRGQLSFPMLCPAQNPP